MLRYADEAGQCAGECYGSHQTPCLGACAQAECHGKEHDDVGAGVVQPVAIVARFFAPDAQGRRNRQHSGQCCGDQHSESCTHEGAPGPRESFGQSPPVRVEHQPRAEENKGNPGDDSMRRYLGQLRDRDERMLGHDYQGHDYGGDEPTRLQTVVQPGCEPGRSHSAATASRSGRSTSLSACHLSERTGISGRVRGPVNVSATTRLVASALEGAV